MDFHELLKQLADTQFRLETDKFANLEEAVQAAGPLNRNDLFFVFAPEIHFSGKQNALLRAIQQELLSVDKQILHDAIFRFYILQNKLNQKDSELTRYLEVSAPSAQQIADYKANAEARWDMQVQEIVQKMNVFQRTGLSHDPIIEEDVVDELNISDFNFPAATMSQGATSYMKPQHAPISRTRPSVQRQPSEFAQKLHAELEKTRNIKFGDTAIFEQYDLPPDAALYGKQLRGERLYLKTDWVKSGSPRIYDTETFGQCTAKVHEINKQLFDARISRMQ